MIYDVLAQDSVQQVKELSNKTNNNMGFKRLVKKNLLGGGIIQGHIFDAIQKKRETGKSFRDCLEQSVKETFTEDMPGTSHLYNLGRKDGRVQGTVEQAARDKKKMQKQHEQHEKDRKKWNEIDKQKDDLIDDLSRELFSD